jgi:hypothetical protein
VLWFKGKKQRNCYFGARFAVNSKNAFPEKRFFTGKPIIAWNQSKTTSKIPLKQAQVLWFKGKKQRNCYFGTRFAVKSKNAFR